MITETGKISQAIYAAIDEVNQMRPPDQQLQKSAETTLLGKNGSLDSLAAVNLIVATEMNIEIAFGVAVNLADDKAMTQENSPFRTVATFRDYIQGLLEEKVSG